MAARRLIIVMLTLLVISSIAAALVPVEEAQRDSERSSTTTSKRQQADSGELVSKQINAGAARPPTISAHVGDQLVLTVTSRKPDQAAIPALGELADVGPDAAARFDLLLSEPGGYAVRLVDAERTVGRLDVEPRRAETKAKQRKGSKTSKDSNA